MAHAAFETVDGKSIFHIDFRGCKEPKEALATIADAKAKVGRCPKDSVYTLTDITDATYDDVVATALKELAAANKPFVKAAAVVGVTGLRKVVFNMIIMFSKRQMSLFADQAAARKWLVAQQQ